MKKLLSLPPNLVGSFHEIANADPADWFCTSDPIGARLGSGGGTTWLLEACRRDDDTAGTLSTGEWLAREKRILLHPSISLKMNMVMNGWRVKSGFYCMPEGRAGVCPGMHLRARY